MKKNSDKTYLAQKYLTLLLILLKVINEALDIMSKVVNYASTFRKLCLQIPRSKRKTRLCAIG